jgi:hypothetical protein
LAAVSHNVGLFEGGKTTTLRECHGFGYDWLESQTSPHRLDAFFGVWMETLPALLYTSID